MLCGVEYYDDAGDVVENLSFPRICYPCDEKGQVGKQRRGKGRKSKSNDGISSPKTASAAGIDSGSPKSPSTDLSNDKTITRSSGRRQQSTQKPSPRSKRQTSKKNTTSKESPPPVVINTEEIFSKEESDEFYPGFRIVSDLKRGEKVKDRFNSIPESFHSRTSVIDKIVNIPATYWGDLATEDESKMWWKNDIHDDVLRALKPDEMNNAILYGKVLQKAKYGTCYEVVLFNAMNEICMIHGGEIRKFLYDDGGGGKKSVGETADDGNDDNSNNTSTKTRGNRKKKQKTSHNPRGRVSTIPENEEGEDLAVEYDSDDLIEENDELSSEDDLQVDDRSESEDEVSDETDNDDDQESDDDDPDFVRREPRTKEIRKWTVVENHTATNYVRPVTESYVNSVRLGGWNELSPADIFLMQLPDDEIRLWCQHTSLNLVRENKKDIAIDEMKQFLGCLFAATQGRKVGGITKCFETVSDGLFPAMDLGRFGMNLRRFQQVMKCFEFANEYAPGVDKEDKYWRTEQLFNRFNEHYATIVNHGTYVNVDERIFWSYARCQPEGQKHCGRKPKGTGQECKTLSCIDMSVTTTFEHVRGNSKNEYIRDLQKDYGKAASVVMRLCKKAKIEGTNRIVIADSWFANLSLYRGLQHLGLHLIGMIKQGDGGFPKAGLCKLLDVEGKERGSHVVAETSVDDKKVIAVAWKGKSDKYRKGKKRKFWMSTFIASDCTTTLPGPPAEKKRHTPEGARVNSVFVPRPKLVADYYHGMPGTDIVNRNAQFLIGLEAAIRTQNIHKRMFCTVLGTWMANAYGMAMKYYPYHRKKEITTHSFVRSVILEGLFQIGQQTPSHPFATRASNNISTDMMSISTTNSANSNSRTTSITSRASSVGSRRSLLPPVIVQQLPVNVGPASSETNTQELIDSQAIDPYVHTMQRFSDAVAGACRQQRCVMCYHEGRQTKTSMYCSLCTLTATRECDRKPSRHAYCINVEHNCFSRHIAKCYKHMNQTGMMAQRESIRNSLRKGQVVEQQEIPIAGRVINRQVPNRRRRRGRKNNNGRRGR